MTVSVHATGTAVNGTGSLTPTIPGTPVAGDMLIAEVAAATASETIFTSTPGWEVLKQGNTNGYALYAKKAVGSDANPQFDFSGGSSHIAKISVLRSTVGFPAVSSLLVDSTASSNSGGAAGSMVYAALAITQEGKYGFQFGRRNLTTAATNLVTAVATTASYTTLGFGARNTNSGIVIAGQMFGPGSPTIAGDIPANSPAITGNSDDNARQSITITITEAATTFPFTADTVVDSTHSALPPELVAQIPGGLGAGDTYGQNGASNPPGAVFTLANSGAVTIDFSASGSDQVMIPFHFLDSSTGDVWEYSVVFSKSAAPPQVALGHIRRRLSLAISLGL